jgi:hypothetical protein
MARRYALPRASPLQRPFDEKCSRLVVARSGRLAGDRSCLPLTQSGRSRGIRSPISDQVWIALISTMRTARPTTGPPLFFSEAGTAPIDPASPCFSLFGRLDPTDPFIARERRNVLPRLQRFCVGGQCLSQVRGQVMDHTA